MEIIALTFRTRHRSSLDNLDVKVARWTVAWTNFAFARELDSEVPVSTPTGTFTVSVRRVRT